MRKNTKSLTMRQESTIRDGGPGCAGEAKKPKHEVEAVTEWILILTLYSKSGQTYGPIREEGFKTEWECGKRAGDLASDLLLTTPDLRNIKPLCIEDSRKAPLHATELP